MKFVYIFIILLSISFASAFNFPDTSTTSTVNFYTGNLTNLSEMGDVNIPAPTDNYVLTWDDATSMWIAKDVGIVGDTNETTRFNALVNIDCPVGYLVIGVQANGTVLCSVDAGGNSSFNQTLTDSLYADISVTGGNSSWNETYASTLYADISVTGDNSSWSQSLADSLYAILGYGDNWNKTYADTLYAAFGSGNLSWNETYASTLYYLITNPYGFFNSTNFPYTHLSNFTNDLGYINATHLSNFTNDLGLSNYTHLTNFTDDLGNRGYTNNLNFTNGANFWNDTYATFNKTYADNLYASISVTGDNSSWNETYANTIYAIIGYGDDWNKTYADTLYADISITGGNESFNQSLTDTLYYNILNPSSFWNDTYATFNKTYADTLYADISITGDNSSWNETHANTLYASISVTGDNSSWNENYANSIYAPINYGDNWNKTYADTLYSPVSEPKAYNGTLAYNSSLDNYYLKSNPYSFWNSTWAGFNKTYADTLYVEIGVGNSSYVPYTGANQNVVIGNNNFSVNGSTLFVNTNTGNVGIGTTSPSALLHIVTTGTANNLKLDSTGSGVSGLSVATGGTIKGYWALTRINGQYFTDALAGDMAFRSESNKILFGQGSGVSTMTINAGNVGIGTATPNSKLEVNGSINVSSGNDVCIEGGSCLSTIFDYYLKSNPYSFYNSTSLTEDDIEAYIFDNDNTGNLNMTDNYNITMGGCTQYWNGTCLFFKCSTTTSIQC